MEGIEERLEKVNQLIDAIAANRDEMIATAISDTGFTRRECTIEVDMVLSNLKGFEGMATLFAERPPLCDKDQEVALLLPYNGSAWLNTAIISIYMVGNRVRVKFASRGSRIAKLTESIYNDIFGDFIRFDYDEGRHFLEKAISNPNVPAICLFGTDEYAFQYYDDIWLHQKKFVFEGPGKDPFIVLPGADLEDAARELADSKYIYAGQTCTAPERVYLDASIHDDFLDIFLDFSRAVRVGDPEDPETEMGPVASPRAIAAIKAQLDDAIKHGGKIELGGQIEGNLVYPTVVINANHNMLGMQDETFGPVVFVHSFETPEEVISLSRESHYGLRAAIYGGDEEGQHVGKALVGEAYCHQVSAMTFGRFGTVAVNEPRSESWVGAFVSKAVGGYGYSGWIWETVDGQLVLKQGPKLLSIETSIEIAG